MKVAGYGLSCDLPDGWECEIDQRPSDEATVAGRDDRATGAARAAADTPGHAVAHVANFALPGDRGDFGSGAVEVMGPDDVLVCVVEYTSDDAASTLFRSEGVPRVAVEDFSPSAMQRTIAGMSGTQHFFSVGSRAFCLYAVLGSHARRRVLVPRINALLETLDVTEN